MLIFQMLSLRRVPVTLRQSVRSVYTVTETNNKALVLGVVWGKESFTLTLSGWKLVERLAAFGNVVDRGYLSPHVIAVGLDSPMDIEPGEAEENVDSVRESTRTAAGVSIAGGSKVKTMEM